MFVNGKKRDFENFLVSEMLQKLDLSLEKVVIELNLEILPKEEYGKTTLRKDDNIEIVAFVGGG